MPWGGTSDPLKFRQAISWFAARAVFTKDEWTTLAQAAQARAFTITGVAQLDVITSVHTSLKTAVDEGKDFADWKKEVRDQLESAWGGTVSRPGHRMETIYRNALQSSYSAGRYEQQTRPAVMLARPYWMIDAVLDDLTSTICRSLNGITLPADHVWWQTHYSPFHHRCRTGIRSLRKSEGEARIAEGWGDIANVVDPQGSWGHAPNRPDWEPRPEDYPPALWNAYERVRSRRDAPLPGPVAEVIDEAAD